MPSSRTIDRIAKLLRLADDRAGEPEGETARALADKLMQEHGVTITLEAEPQTEPDWPSLGSYASREPWRDAIASLVAWLYDLAIDWRPRPDGKVDLLVEPDPPPGAPVSGPQRTKVAKAAYRALCSAIDGVDVPQMRVPLPRHMVVSIYKAGIAVGVASRFADTQPFVREVPEDGTTSLARLRVVRAPRAEEPVSEGGDVPLVFDAAELRERAERSRSKPAPEEDVWQRAVARGVNLWVPTPPRPDMARSAGRSGRTKRSR